LTAQFWQAWSGLLTPLLWYSCYDSSWQYSCCCCCCLVGCSADPAAAAVDTATAATPADPTVTISIKEDMVTGILLDIL